MTEDLPEETDIRKLDDDTVAQIAAGEVVERPASVVKELVENSLDADATRIEVAVERGGVDGVRVRDDGMGMSEADVRAAVREHTTSKLDDAGELQRVGTLGFRGEALHTIGAVSRMEITTRPRGGEDAGTRLRYVGGEVEEIAPAGCPEGTTVAVEDLFFNTPARRKYLGEPATEFRHVSRVVGRYALANPEVAVALSHDGSEVFATTGQGDRRSAIMSVYGRDVAESMLRVEAEPAGPIERIYGYVSDPETTRASRAYLATYVNDRYVEPDAIRGAIVEAYGGGLAADRYPFAVLFVDVPPERVDVNVHPRKLAVRFDDEAAVAEAVESAAREALADAGYLRSSAPRGRSAPEEVRVEPGAIEHEADAIEREADATGHGENADRAASTDDVAESDDGSEQTTTGPSHGSTRTTHADPTSPGDVDGQTPASDASTTKRRHSGVDAASREPGRPAERSSEPTDCPSTSTESSSTSTESSSTSTERSGRIVDSDRKFDATEQRALDGEPVEREHDLDRLPPLRVLGQAHDTYLVAESSDGLALIDQHAADERIHYERLKAELDGDTTVQALAEPVELSLTPDEAATFDEYAPALARLGFHADRDGQRVEVRSVPAVFDETLAPDRLRDVFEALLADGEGVGAATVEALAEELLADLACAPAVTGNTSLAEGSVAALLSALDDCEYPYECPHGRPTIIELDEGELSDRFERDYPGHGMRRDS